MLELPAMGVVSGAALLGAAGVQMVRTLSDHRSRRRTSLRRGEANCRLFAGELDAALRWARASTPSHKAWSGLRTFHVSAIVDECDDCRSFYLVPADGRSLPRFEPGQYLTFHLP
ncbi:MAG: hypothetical protein KDA61_03470, partial [Planctomycetales bacterium]|nr:hypothetical protein [Planctomycetales bacterium]